MIEYVLHLFKLFDLLTYTLDFLFLPFTLSPTMVFSTMDSFTEPYTRAGDDISLDDVRKHVRALEVQHRANGIPLSGPYHPRPVHDLPVIATLTNRAGVLSPPATPPTKVAEVPESPSSEAPNAPTIPESDSKGTAAWTLAPRYGHAAMISGIVL